jgi:hypothetical protein
MIFSYKYVVAILATFVAALFFAGLVGQTVYAQTQGGVTDYTGLFQAIGGLVVAIATLGGLIVQALSKMNAKMHLVDQSVIEKASTILNTVKDSDFWTLENEKQLTAVLTFMYNTSPDAKKYMDDHAMDVKKMSESTEDTRKQLEDLYTSLTATVNTSALK